MPVVLQDGPILIDGNNGVDKVGAMLLEKDLQLIIRFHTFHLLADIYHVVFYVLEHVYLRYYQFPQTVGLER